MTIARLSLFSHAVDLPCCVFRMVLASIGVALILFGGCSRQPAVKLESDADQQVDHTVFPESNRPGTKSTVTADAQNITVVPEDSFAVADSFPPDLPAAPSGSLEIAELEDLYSQAMAQVVKAEYDRAQDLVFILQDQVLSCLSGGTESLYLHHRRSIERRLILLSGLITEGRAFAAGPAAADSILAAGYRDLTRHDFPDSLVPIIGKPRSAVAADLMHTDNEAVRKWVRYFTGPGRRHFAHWLLRKEAVDSLVTSILAEEDLPRELVYLSMIESGLSSYARSNMGAVGPWQFMPGTAKLYHLRQDWWVDERKDLEMSTRAACKHLQKLYAQFGDWALVLAAYNSGENRIRRSIRFSGHDNYWQLRLPSQTSDFVPKFIAAARLGEQPEEYGFSVDSLPALHYDIVPVDDATDLGLIARCAGVTKEQVLNLNPALLRRASPPDSPGYPVRVPAGSGNRCRAELRKIPAAERLTWRRHKVVRGETLSQIATMYGTTVKDLARLNQLRSVHLIRPGDQLLIPMPATLAAKARRRAAEKGHYVPPDGYVRVSYRVKDGDTLSGIARRLGVSLKHLRKVNGLYKTSLIRPGQRLYAYRPPHRG